MIGTIIFLIDLTIVINTIEIFYHIGYHNNTMLTTCSPRINSWGTCRLHNSVFLLTFSILVTAAPIISVLEASSLVELDILLLFLSMVSGFFPTSSEEKNLSGSLHFICANSLASFVSIRGADFLTRFRSYCSSTSTKAKFQCLSNATIPPMQNPRILSIPKNYEKIR